MKKSVILCIVALLTLSITGPVRAAIIWEWHAGDECTWYCDDCGETPTPPICDTEGITLPGEYFTVASTENLPYPITSQPLNITSNCPDGTMVDIQVGSEHTEFTFGDLPYSVSTDAAAMFKMYATGDPCLVTDITIGQAVTLDDWTLPSNPLTPYTYTVDVPSPEIGLDESRLWEMARVALTSYKIMGGDNNGTWIILALLILVPVAGGIIYRLLINPPDI